MEQRILGSVYKYSTMSLGAVSCLPSTLEENLGVGVPSTINSKVMITLLFGLHYIGQWSSCDC